MAEAGLIEIDVGPSWDSVVNIERHLNTKSLHSMFNLYIVNTVFYLNTPRS